MIDFVLYARNAVRFAVRAAPPVFVACDEGAVWPWTLSTASRDPRAPRWFSKSVYVAVVYPDGSAQLLSRDEDECLLFAALWELER